MDSLTYLLNVLLDVVWMVVVAQVVMSWLIQFEVLNVRQRNVQQANYWINRILEPIYAPLRRVMPPMAGLDLTPLIILVAISIIKTMVPGPGLF